MITGRQIREARQLLGWSLDALSMRANVPVEFVAVADLAEDARGLSPHQAAAVQQAFERAGIRFGRLGGVLKLATEEKPHARS